MNIYIKKRGEILQIASTPPSSSTVLDDGGASCISSLILLFFSVHYNIPLFLFYSISSGSLSLYCTSLHPPIINRCGPKLFLLCSFSFHNLTISVLTSFITFVHSSPAPFLINSFPACSPPLPLSFTRSLMLDCSFILSYLSNH